MPPFIICPFCAVAFPAKNNGTAPTAKTSLLFITTPVQHGARPLPTDALRTNTIRWANVAVCAPTNMPPRNRAWLDFAAPDYAFVAALSMLGILCSTQSAFEDGEGGT